MKTTDDRDLSRVQSRDEGEPLERMFERDGFSPDLPRIFAKKQRTGPGLKLFLYMLSGIRIGKLDVQLPDGSLHRFEGAEAGPHGQLQIHSAGLLRHVVLGGELGFGEAYMERCWDSPDLTALLCVMYRNTPYFRGPFEKNWLGRVFGYWQHRLRDNTKTKAKRNIEYHYDLGNEFYRLWLDPTMAYSSAVFAHPNDTLEAAQYRKFDQLLERLRIEPGQSLLEIGSGWGGFAIHAALRTGCTVHSITLSGEQLAEAKARALAAGVADRVRFELRDYRDLDSTYDRVVSVEMYEAVGEAFWPTWFQTLHRALKPGGIAAVQGITVGPELFERYRTRRDFIQKYIFPGGMLCPPELFQALAGDAGLEAQDPRFFASDYARTLAIWHDNVLASREAITQQFGERFLQMWRYYLAYCECGFLTGSIDLMQITLKRPG